MMTTVLRLPALHAEHNWSVTSVTRSSQAGETRWPGSGRSDQPTCCGSQSRAPRAP